LVFHIGPFYEVLDGPLRNLGHLDATCRFVTFTETKQNKRRDYMSAELKVVKRIFMQEVYIIFGLTNLITSFALLSIIKLELMDYMQTVKIQMTLAWFCLVCVIALIQARLELRSKFIILPILIVLFMSSGFVVMAASWTILGMIPWVYILLVGLTFTLSGFFCLFKKVNPLDHWNPSIIFLLGLLFCACFEIYLGSEFTIFYWLGFVFCLLLSLYMMMGHKTMLDDMEAKVSTIKDAQELAGLAVLYIFFNFLIIPSMLRGKTHNK
jgi:hypothetical protein